MFTIRLISDNEGPLEYNFNCARYEKNVGKGRLECWGCIGFDDDYQIFDIDGNPYTHGYVMNPEGNTIDTICHRR